MRVATLLFLCHIRWVVNQHSMTVANRPQVIMEREDYSATFELLIIDFKTRCKIHQYEVNLLMEDLSFVLNTIADKAFYIVTDQ